MGLRSSDFRRAPLWAKLVGLGSAVTVLSTWIRVFGIESQVSLGAGGACALVAYLAVLFLGSWVRRDRSDA